MHAAYGHIAELLLERGAAVDAKNLRGETSLMLAALKGAEDIIQALLEAGAAVDARNKQGSTAAQMARDVGETEAAILLEQWPEKQKQQKAEQHAQWLEKTNCHKGLERPIRAVHPFNLPRKKDLAP